MSNRYPLSPWIKFSCALGVLLALMLASPSHSAVFKWKDENGKTHFTDSLSKIPPQYREKGELKTIDGTPAKSSKPVQTRRQKKEQQEPRGRPITHVIKAKSGSGGHYVVEVLLNGTVKADLIVDTGATMIILSDRIGKRLGIHPRSNLPKIEMTTAGGKLETPLFVLDSLKIGEAEVFNVEASTNPHMGKMDGLLGITFLGEFRMEMDRENSELILKPLGSPEDELWDGKNGAWWKKKYKAYSGNLRQLQRAAHQGGSDVRKTMEIKRLITHYEKLHEGLESRADLANLPKKYRSYP